MSRFEQPPHCPVHVRLNVIGDGAERVPGVPVPRPGAGVMVDDPYAEVVI